MVRFLLSVACLALTAIPALGGDVTFAEPSPTRLGHSTDTYYSSLDDIMLLTQLRHMKLWQAARAGNWPLVIFELNQIEGNFGKAAMFYQHLPVSYVQSVEQPVGAMRRASEAMDIAKFNEGFGNLTAACNACHQAARVGFVVIQSPTSTPFSDQTFSLPVQRPGSQPGR